MFSTLQLNIISKYYVETPCCAIPAELLNILSKIIALKAFVSINFQVLTQILNSITLHRPL